FTRPNHNICRVDATPLRIHSALSFSTLRRFVRSAQTLFQLRSRKMQQSFVIACGLLLGLQLTAADQAPITPQAERGREIFLKSAKGTPCGRCHLMAGVGKAVGPNLATLASTVGPKGLVTTFKMTVYAYVKDYHLSSETFPGIER